MSYLVCLDKTGSVSSLSLAVIYVLILNSILVYTIFMTQRPLQLNPGDLVGIVAPASPPRDPEQINWGVEQIKRLGFRVKLGKYVRRRLGYLAGTDQQRCSDLMRMFSDPGVKGIFAFRGGHGATRLLDRIDFSVVKRNPKIFVGFSDITALHWAFLKKAGLVTFHGPHLTSQFGNSVPPQFVLDSVTKCLCRDGVVGSICEGYPEKDKTITVLRSGQVTAPLVGGNLAIICNLIGTPWEVSLKGKILFIEDVGEPPRRIDRNLTFLLNSRRLQGVAGVAVGICVDCHDQVETGAGECCQSVFDVLKDRLYGLKVPVVVGLPFGHCQYNAMLPMGLKARLDGDNGDLVIMESAVRGVR